MASLTKHSDYLTELIDVGADAMTNLYYVEISGVGDLNVAFRVRNQDFTPPSFSQKTYEKSYMSVSMDAPAAEYTGNKNFVLNLRLDEDYAIYKKLLELMNKVNNPVTGFASTTVNKDSTSNGFNVDVYVMVDSATTTDKATYFNKDSNGFTLAHKYEYCWISDISTPHFTYANASPLTAQVTIEFFKHTDYIKKEVDTGDTGTTGDTGKGGEQ